MKITACVNPEPDSFPPVIESFAPPSGSYMQFSATSFSFTAYLDEPGQCKFDYERLIPYEDMSDENAMLCNLEDDESLEYFCGAILTNIASDQTDISVYIKCNDSSGNVNSNFDEAKYDIIRTPAPLNITSTYANTFLIPEEGIVIERTSVSEFFTLEATTEGGVDNGISLCRFKFAEVKWRNNFQKTNSREHKSVFNSLPSGTHTIQILCKDSIGNTAEKTITITSKIHDAKPIITRVYGRGNSITLATDEEARCYYSNKDCYFDITNRSESTQIIIYYDIKQEFGADDKQTYYIRCQDKYDKMSDCLSVKLSEL